MKKIYLSFIFLLALLASCDPASNGGDIGGRITAEELNISATLVVVNGKKSNKVVVENHSPVSSYWDCGIKSSVQHSDTVLLFKEGVNEINFNGLNPDGTMITKTLTVDVEEMTFPVPVEFSYLFGDGERTWIWAETACWGNGGYLANDGPAWSKYSPADIDANPQWGAPNEGTNTSMVFSISGGALTKNKNDNTSLKGKFDLDMEKTTLKDDGTVWAKGKFKTAGTNVLSGINGAGGAKVYEYDILFLDENKMILAYAPPGSGAWATTWFWVFEAKK